jgi:hypothetical protein
LLKKESLFANACALAAKLKRFQNTTSFLETLRPVAVIGLTLSVWQKQLTEQAIPENTEYGVSCGNVAPTLNVVRTGITEAEA